MVREEWTAGEYEGWSNTLPSLTMEEGCEIGLRDLWKAPDKGSTFYSDSDTDRA